MGRLPWLLRRLLLPSPRMAPFLSRAKEGEPSRKPAILCKCPPLDATHRTRHPQLSHFHPRSASKSGKTPEYLSHCVVCGARDLDTGESLKSHVKAHIEEKGGKFVCPLAPCRRQLRSSKGMTYHLVEVHHRVAQPGALLMPEPALMLPERVHCECWECAAQFDDADKLEAHVSTHLQHGAYPMDCPLLPAENQAHGDGYCPFQGATAEHLARHAVLVHYKVAMRCPGCGASDSSHACHVEPEVRRRRGVGGASHSCLTLNHGANPDAGQRAHLGALVGRPSQPMV
jgi:hypothetical protein